MQPLPYTDPAAKIAFYVLVGVFVALEFRIRLRSTVNRQGSRAERFSLVTVFLSIGGGIAGAVVLAGTWLWPTISIGRWPIFVLGLILMGAGIVLRQWSILTLGRFFTTDVRLQEGQTVVETGPYRWVRHPSYTGLLVTLLGFGLALGNWAALAVIVVVPLVGLIVRIRYEERVLLDGLGEPYRAFAANRRRLVPGVW